MLDSLISLPIISFLALPMLSSYTTSLNLLFFYMTWTTLVMSHTPLQVEFFGTLIIRVLFYLVPSLLSLALDTGVPSIAIAIKAQGDIAMPLRYGRRRVLRITGWSIFNTVLEVALIAGIDVLLTRVLQLRSVLNIAIRLPLPWKIATDLLKGFALRGILQFYLHKHVLHGPRSLFSTQHRTWHHSVAAPFSVCAAYDNPACYLLYHFLPLYLPAVLFHYHILTFHLFLALLSLEEFLTSSGYTVLPSTILVAGAARRHDAHMLSGGRGNFTPWGVLDWAHGTSVGEDDVVDDIGAEMDKHDVQGRAESAADSVGGLIDSASSKVRNRKKSKK